MSDRYRDIINLPHHVSEVHPPMSLRDRAGQFAPFAALTGYGESIDEAARYTESRITQDESEIEIINDKLNLISQEFLNKSPVTVRHFVPDSKKTGGAYVDTTGIVKKIEAYSRTVLMQDGTRIPITEIIAVELFPEL